MWIFYTFIDTLDFEESKNFPFLYVIKFLTVHIWLCCICIWCTLHIIVIALANSVLSLCKSNKCSSIIHWIHCVWHELVQFAREHAKLHDFDHRTVTETDAIHWTQLDSLHMGSFWEGMFMNFTLNGGNGQYFLQNSFESGNFVPEGEMARKNVSILTMSVSFLNLVRCHLLEWYGISCFYLSLPQCIRFSSFSSQHAPTMSSSEAYRNIDLQNVLALGQQHKGKLIELGFWWQFLSFFQEL